MGVGHDLEGQRGERLVVVRLALELLVALEVHARDRREVERRRQVVDDGVEQGLHALVLEGRAGEDGHDAVVDGGLAQRPLEVVGGDLLVAEELLEDVVVVVRDDVDELLAVLVGLVLRARRGCRRRRTWRRAPRRARRGPSCRAGRSTPLKLPSAPIGSWMTAMVAPRRSLIESSAAKKSAPMRSILLMKHMRGTSYLLAWRHTVSVWGSTPATPSNTATAPSSTRSERSTSTVKSTWPGVSMMLMRWSFQKAVVAAEVMVMPRSCSWTI